VGAGEVAVVLQWGPTPENRSIALDAGSAAGVSRDLDIIAVFDAVKPTLCSGCNPGTSGPCRQSNNDNCWPYVAGTVECPHYATACATAQVQQGSSKRARLPPAPCRVFDRRKKCGGASKGAELQRRDQLVSPAPTPSHVASRYGIEVLVLRKLLATTYTLAVRNRDLSYAMETSRASLTVYAGGKRTVSRPRRLRRRSVPALRCTTPTADQGPCQPQESHSVPGGAHDVLRQHGGGWPAQHSQLPAVHAHEGLALRAALPTLSARRG
jgi:hypothetical protein